MHKTDVVIIGAGPVGLFAIFELGMLKMRCHVVDTLPFIGGQCTALYPEKPIYDVAGFPAVDAEKLIENLANSEKEFYKFLQQSNQLDAILLKLMRCAKG